MVDDRVRDGVHDRERTQPHVLGVGIHSLADVREPTVVAMPDRHHEIAVDEDHDLAGLDDLASQQGGLVWHIVEGLEHQEQRFVVTLQLGPLVSADRVLDGQRVHAERIADLLHLMLGGGVQADPGEGFLAAQLQLANLGLSLGVTERPGQSLTVQVDTAVDDRLFGGRLRGRRTGRLVPLRPCQRTQRFRYVAKRRHPSPPVAARIR